MKHLFLLFIYMLICTSLESCSKAVEPQGDGISPIAVLICSDTIFQVGNYCTLDASKSSNGNGDTLIYNWEEDVDNPVSVFLNNLENKQKIGFIKEGLYKFRLTVNNGKQNSNTEQIEIKVNSREQVIFEDPSLEIQVRYALKQPTEKLTNENLLTIDSLSYMIFTKLYVSSLKGLDGCRNITYLNMGIQNISDISALAQLVKLKYLNLTQNRLIKDITPLQYLVNLESLDLQSNLVEDVSALINLRKLKYLNMIDNPIADLNPISNLKKLEELWLSYLKNGNLTFITGLENLSLLWMPSCNVADIIPIKDLTNICKINFDGNQIKDISPVTDLKKLQTLYLDKNQIEDITPLESLENLQRLRLWNNQITNIIPLINNLGLGEGDSVGLWGNPLDSISVNEYVPELRARGVYVEW